MSSRLDAVIAAIDDANALDPNVLHVDGRPQPKELAHSEMVSSWVLRFDPEASEEQLIAARAHHLRRWVSPRQEYPDGRAGYLRWRRDAGERHRAEVAALMVENGYDASAVAAVQRIMAKRGLGSERSSQVHEDALCMVFLETQLDDLVDRLGPERSADVIAKTMRKMSPDAKAAAGSLRYSDRAKAVLELAADVDSGEV